MPVDHRLRDPDRKTQSLERIYSIGDTMVVQLRCGEGHTSNARD